MRKVHLLWSILVAACCLALVAPASAHMEDFSQVKTMDDFRSALSRSTCSTSTGNLENCLQRMTQNACASGCERVGYNYCFVDSRDEKSNCTDPKSPDYKTRLDIHGLNEYLKALRKLATANPAARAPKPFRLTMEEMLYHQFQMMLRHPDVLYYDDTLALMAPGTYETSNHTIDPTKFRMVAWVNEGGIAHAMTQADLGLSFLKVAVDWARQGRGDQIEYYLRMSRRAYESYSVRVDDGGVRNNKRSYKCHNGAYCYWFHGRDIETYAEPSSVLNKHLYAVRNALQAHQILSEWLAGHNPEGDPVGVPLPVEFQGLNIHQHLEWARGGLAQLAFSVGNYAATPDVPPNLQQFLEFMAPDGDGDGEFYRAYYDWDMSEQAADPNTTAVTDCHYHYFTLKVFSEILSMLSTDTRYTADPALVELRYKLLYGRNAPDTRSCDANESMRGVPLAELYYGGLYAPFQEDCVENEPAELQSGTNWYASNQAYADCPADEW